MFWALIGIPVLLILIGAYLSDKRRQRKYRFEELDHAAKHNSRSSAEAEAQSRTWMDSP